MITISDVQRHVSIPFQFYQKLPGISTSFLKKQRAGVATDFVMTDKIKIGSLVDAILTEPEKADMLSPLYPIAKQIAHKLKESFGDMMKHFSRQVSYTGTLKYRAFKMQVRGRLDYELPGHAVIDLKVTDSSNIEALIEFMRYKEQMFLYCKFSGVTKAYLFVYCVPKKTCTVHFIDCSADSEWWIDNIITFGTIE